MAKNGTLAACPTHSWFRMRWDEKALACSFVLRRWRGGIPWQRMAPWPHAPLIPAFGMSGNRFRLQYSSRKN